MTNVSQEVAAFALSVSPSAWARHFFCVVSRKTSKLLDFLVEIASK
jgi:hypothetical protein